MFHRDFRRHQSLLDCATECFGQRRCCHRARHPDFSLTATHSCRNRGALLEERADLAGDEQEVNDPRLGNRLLREAHVVQQHCRDDARCTVGRCRDNSAKVGVLFVHCHRERADPLQNLGETEIATLNQLNPFA